MNEPPQGVKISAYIFFAMAALTLLGTCAIVALIGISIADTGGGEIQTAALAPGQNFGVTGHYLYSGGSRSHGQAFHDTIQRGNLQALFNECIQ